MDYVVGGVAALISGNVTPNRPRLVKRALTPTKHPVSPNVTPKSEFVEDRSIFLSPTMQKKKAIVKKSPKRIFENQDLDVSLDGDAIVSSQADKVKKHLSDDLDTSSKLEESVNSQKSPKKKRKSQTPIKVENNTDKAVEKVEPIPKKAKTLGTSTSEDTVSIKTSKVENNTFVSKNNPVAADVKKSPKKRNRKKNKGQANNASIEKMETNTQEDKTEKATDNTNKLAPAENTKNKKKRNRKKKKSASQDNPTVPEKNNAVEQQDSSPSKKNKNLELSPEPAMEGPAKKMKKEKSTPQVPPQTAETEDKSEKKSKKLVNPNAVTDKDSESEHESDDNIESENDVDYSDNEENSDSEKVEDGSKPDTEDPESSEDEEETEEVKKEEKVNHTPSEEELKRTLFVGNVPFSGKCKKDIKRMFSKYGQIETVRIRSIPMKDSRDTPKLAVIKNELHPDRSTVNVYVKFADAEAREMALAENGTVLSKCHLRVTRADTTGAEHDPRLAVYIGNMPFALEDEALRARFEKCGEIESVRIVRDKKSNVGKGFGYVNFKSKDGVELALALTDEDLTFKNRILRVQRCIQGGGRNKAPARGGGRGRGGPHRDGQTRDGPDRSQSSDRGSFNRGGGRGFGPVRGRGGLHRGGFGQDSRGGRGGGRDFGPPRGRGGGRDFGPPRGRGGGRDFGPPRGRGGGRDFGPPRGRGGGRDFGPPRGRGWGGRGGPGRGGAGGSWGERNGEGGEGAHRRIMNKRKNEEGGSDGPPSKFPKSDQPPRQKKEKKEFVGLTSEKKKKQKFSKDQKRKKALSEILTK